MKENVAKDNPAKLLLYPVCCQSAGWFGLLSSTVSSKFKFGGKEKTFKQVGKQDESVIQEKMPLVV